MDLLFLSKRIYLGTEEGFIHGGIIVDTEGIIRQILRSAKEVNSYIYSNESEAVGKIQNCFYKYTQNQSYINIKYIKKRAINRANFFVFQNKQVYDFENMVLMPGLIDVNVNTNEPGEQSSWEGFVTATKAAAAGGITTIIDGAR